jgi:tRNA1Val (adenine37-N6)-methyltransferase
MIDNPIDTQPTDSKLTNTLPMDTLALEADETLEDLQRGNLRLIQKKDGFRFGEDSVFLAAFAADLVRAKKHIRVADLGAGSGAVSLLLAGRLPQATITGIELCPRPCDVFARNIALNRLADQLKAVCGDVREPNLFERASLDLIVSNPPYRDPGRHLSRPSVDEVPLDFERRAALETTTLPLDQLVAAAGRWLKPGGYFALVHRPANLPDVLAAMRSCRIEPTLLRAIVPLPGRAPTSLLVAGRLHGKSGSFRWLPDLLVCDQPGHYSVETQAIYCI